MEPLRITGFAARDTTPTVRPAERMGYTRRPRTPEDMLRNAAEIEQDKTGLRQFRIFDPPANAFEQVVGRAKEDEALQF